MSLYFQSGDVSVDKSVSLARERLGKVKYVSLIVRLTNDYFSHFVGSGV